eukprot:52853-Chlamydomonas_euryale.AAC.4
MCRPCTWLAAPSRACRHAGPAAVAPMAAAWVLAWTADCMEDMAEGAQLEALTFGPCLGAQQQARQAYTAWRHLRFDAAVLAAFLARTLGASAMHARCTHSDCTEAVHAQPACKPHMHVQAFKSDTWCACKVLMQCIHAEQPR